LNASGRFDSVLPVIHPSIKKAWQASWRGLFALGLLAILGIIAFFGSSCMTINERTMFAPPEVEGASFVGNKTCAECHVNYTQTFHSSLHSRLHFTEANVAGGVGCESCHGPGSLHVKAGGGRGKFIVNPGVKPESCLQCHLDVHADFKLPQHHPVLEGKMNCVDCHDPHGSDILKPKGGLAMSRLNESCAQCHREQTRPVIFEHEALREGCTTCHSPHGSINDKMLVQRDNNLCLKCHAQTHSATGDIFIGDTPHTQFISRGSCWTSGCHSAVHGSNVDSHLRY
jgi:predicted CXXCH cytochrome family protein